MNKNDLIAQVADETKLTKADCSRVLEAALGIAKTAIRKGDDLRLVGFGTFVRARRSARLARNPQTGKEIQIKAHYVPRFRPGKEFRDYLR